MSLTEEKIGQMNACEQQQSPAFFEEFIQSITVFEDDDILVVDKPAGLLSVDGRVLKVSLLNRLERVKPSIKLIHRLDMDTSGVMIFAKSSEAQTHISKQFIERLPQKEYQAVVFGKLAEVGAKGIIDVPVRYEPTTKPRHIVDMNWKKHALTKYEVLSHEICQGEQVTRVKLLPVTGRSHQLRVHMLHLGHVMIGDPIYATGKALELSPRLNLHAHKLRLKHPTDGSWREWQTDVPF
ncbi:MAG: RluA family pseudouridine synthase [Moraxellaceae bacterium]|nr:RluA family pseudouridine synthase [Moraxellaceae bacterium]